jgi:hypothetical protein
MPGAGNVADLDPVYALNAELIEIIVEVLPGVLTTAQQAFERRMANVASGGFFRRQPFDYPLLAVRSDEQRRGPQIREMLVREMSDDGATDVQIQRYFREESRYQEMSSLRAIAYADWLIKNRQFRQERDALKRQIGAAIKQAFPPLPRTVLGETPQPSLDHSLSPLREFYARWCLDSFVTWDLPLPMMPDLRGFITYDTWVVAKAGLGAFLPWYLHRDQQFNLRQFGSHLQTTVRPDHLKGWLVLGANEQRRFGYTRLRNQFLLYRYRTLALEARYSDRLVGKTEQVDRAFGKFLRVGEQSVKRLRLDLERRLAESV